MSLRSSGLRDSAASVVARCACAKFTVRIGLAAAPFSHPSASQHWSVWRWQKIIDDSEPADLTLLCLPADFFIVASLGCTARDACYSVPHACGCRGYAPLTLKKLGTTAPTLALTVGGRFNARQGALTMALTDFRRSTLFAAALTLLGVLALTVSGASPARADRCDDLAALLKGQIDGLKVGITASRVIYLSHPLAKELSLGCAGRKFSNELYAKAYSRKPKPEFLDFVSSAAALIFTLPKDEMLKGVSRCMSRMGIFRGDDVSLRYRRLDMNCTRTKTDAAIAISRSPDQ